MKDGAAFMSGRDDIVRYHASGMTVSRMDARDAVGRRAQFLRNYRKQ